MIHKCFGTKEFAKNSLICSNCEYKIACEEQFKIKGFHKKSRKLQKKGISEFKKDLMWIAETGRTHTAIKIYNKYKSRLK